MSARPLSAGTSKGNEFCVGPNHGGTFPVPAGGGRNDQNPDVPLRLLQNLKDIGVPSRSFGPMTSSPRGLQPEPGSGCRSFLARNDIGIILINQFIAEMIRHAIDAHVQSIPAVLEIPSKEHPYDASKDSILRRAKGMFSAEDFR
ncbi:V-type proton ATPase subunit F isoform X1 [Oryzias latipes]